MNSPESLWPFHLFDREAEWVVVHRALPHWSQAGAVGFITWRTIDSMPKQVVDRWFHDRSEWLVAHGIDPNGQQWQRQLHKLDPKIVEEFLDTFWNRWHDSLDKCHGACVLRRPELAKIVADSLLHFDQQRYLLLDYVVMPNHVHLLATFSSEAAMLAQCASWKHFTATQINKRLGQKGHFWQADAFDHLVRSERQFEYLRKYIAANPVRAGLRPGEALHYSRELP